MNRMLRNKQIVSYLKDKGIIENQKDLGAKLGYTNESSFSQVMNGKVDEPKDFKTRLKSLIPDLNLVWLSTGEGEMLSSSQNMSNVTAGGNVLNIHGDSNVENALNGVPNIEVYTAILEELRGVRADLNRREEKLLTIIQNLTTKTQ